MVLLNANVTESVGTISQYIDNYGSTTVVLAVFILIFLVVIISNNNYNKKFIENMIKSNEAYCNSIKEQNEELLEKIILNNSSNYDERDLASIFIKLNTALKQECQKTQRSLNADAVCVYVLHNGMVASHGLPFFKMSCICEWVKKGSGVSYRSKEHSNLPLNLFDTLVTGLFENGEYIINVDEHANTNLSMFLNSAKIVNCLCVAIYDNDNKIMGFITADFSYDIKIENVLEKTKERMIDLASTIKPVLDYSDYQNIKNY